MNDARNFMRRPAADTAKTRELTRLLGRLDPSCRPAAAIEALKSDPSPDPEEIALLMFYLQLWGLDIEIAERYAADPPRFDLTDPLPDFWYQRIDTAGSHAFFQDGVYLTNTIPAASSTNYYNAEIYNSPHSRQQPRCILANLFPVDSPDDLPNFLTDLFLNNPFTPAGGLELDARVQAANLVGGSRGWGFWNTSVLPLTMQVAWFIQFNGTGSGGVTPFYDDGFYAITQNGLNITTTKIADLDEGPHDYRITLADGLVYYFVDGNLVASASGPSVPTAPMTIHYWVDNALFGWDPTSHAIVHIMQETSAPRSNIMERFRVRSLL
jgi:hypothetical protein